MFYEIEFITSQPMPNGLKIFDNEKLMSDVKYSINKRKRWKLLDVLYYSYLSYLKMKLIIIIKNINNNYGIYFTMCDGNKIIMTNEHKNFPLNRTKYCKKNKKGFPSIVSWEAECNNRICVKNTQNVINKSNLSRRKDHRMEILKTKEEYKYFDNTELISYCRIDVSMDTIGITELKRTRFDQSKLKKLNKKWIKYEISDSLLDFYSDNDDLYQNKKYKKKVRKKKVIDANRQLNIEVICEPDTSFIHAKVENLQQNNASFVRERTRPFTSRELKILVGDALGRAFVQLFNERPRDPISHLANILYTMGEEFDNNMHLLDDQLDIISNLP